MNIPQYISHLSALFNTGKSTEHSYRGDLQQLLTGMLKDAAVTNEPKRIECGARNDILSRKALVETDRMMREIDGLNIVGNALKPRQKV